MAYISVTTRAAIRRALPFQSEYPSCAFGAARRDYADARTRELLNIRSSRAILSGDCSAMDRGWHAEQVRATRRYMANLRAARAAILRVEG